MDWRYKFVDLSDEELDRRRYLLDSYGQFAQISVLLLPLIYQLSLGAKLLLSRLQSKPRYHVIKDHRSPPVGGLVSTVSPTGGRTWQQILWSLDNEISPGWGSWKHWLLAEIWTAWLLVLIFQNTGVDYLHLTRRFGIVAASQLPVHYLLAAKSWSPIQYLARMSHEELNIYHRMLGRIISLLLSCHASLYLNFYVQKGLLSKRIRDWDVIFGLLAISSVLLLFTTATARIRDISYRLFFYLHVALSSALLPILFFHVSHVRKYVIEAALVYALIIVQRNVAQTAVAATITRLPGTNLLSISVPLDKFLRSRTYSSGQHIYLGFPALIQKLRINPFSVSNKICPTSKSIQLVARRLNGTTAILDARASQASRPQRTKIMIEGPYGSATYFPDLTQGTYSRILLFAGGVGATFTLPIFEHLEQSLASNSTSRPRVHFVWTVQTLIDASWALSRLLALQRAAHASDEAQSNVDIYVTQHETDAAEEQIEQTVRAVRALSASQSHITSSSRSTYADNTKPSADNGVDALEMETLLSDSDTDSDSNHNSTAAEDIDAATLREWIHSSQSPSQSPINIKIHMTRTRPNIPSIVDTFFSYPTDNENENDNVAVLTCGPASMTRALRKAVGLRIGSVGGEVWWHAEDFGW